MKPSPAATLMPPAAKAPAHNPEAAGLEAPGVAAHSLEAVLWDFDGTLADTEALWIEAEYDLVASLGAQWSAEHAKAMVGKALIDSARHILEVIDRTDLDPDWVVDQLTTGVIERLGTHNIPWRPGALALLESLSAAGVACALVSASYRRMLDVALTRLPAGRFATVVAGDEVRRGKPHPEPYLKACSMLAANPSNCVVLEDSATGAASGNAAGALVLAVPNLVSIPAARRRILLGSLTDLDADRITALLSAANSSASLASGSDG